MIKDGILFILGLLFLLFVLIILIGSGNKACIDGISYLDSVQGVKTLQVDKDGNPVQCEMKK